MIPRSLVQNAKRSNVKNVSLAQDLPTDCYWIVPKEVITIYQAYRKNDVDDFYTCNVPIYIEHIIQVESGDQVSNGIDDQSDLEVDWHHLYLSTVSMYLKCFFKL